MQARVSFSSRQLAFSIYRAQGSTVIRALCFSLVLISKRKSRRRNEWGIGVWMQLRDDVRIITTYWGERKTVKIRTKNHDL